MSLRRRVVLQALFVTFLGSTSWVLFLAIAVTGLFANAGAAVLGRFVDRDLARPAASVTLISLGARQIVGLVLASLGTLVVQMGAGRQAVRGRQPA